jgi:uncharacterized membrane protein SpoIIM required for sporulation
MPYCTRCGTRLYKEEEARFCPNCGAPMVPKVIYEKARVVKAEVRKERKIPTLKNRVAVMAVVMVICLAVTSLGALARVEPSEAQDILQDMKILEDMLEVAGVRIIFGNNLIHCLVMFVPVIGPFYGLYVLYSTGKVLAALGLAVGADPLFLFISLFVYPHTWIEYLSYSLAISESCWLLYSIARRGFGGLRNELTNASKVIAICAVLLLLGAIVETSIILSV